MANRSLITTHLILSNTFNLSLFVTIILYNIFIICLEGSRNNGIKTDSDEVIVKKNTCNNL